MFRTGPWFTVSIEISLQGVVYEVTSVITPFTVRQTGLFPQKGGLIIMPKTRFQGVIFGIIMSMTMAYGMEVYNVAIKMGSNTMAGGFSSMTNQVFLDALIEAAYMWIFVFLFSNLWGNKIGTDWQSASSVPVQTIRFSSRSSYPAVRYLSCAPL